MSRPLLLLSLVTVAWLMPGCATAPPQPPLTTTIEWSPETRASQSEAVAASALVFAPAVAANQPMLDLDRSARQRRAVLGYDEGSVETYRITVDDRQSFSNGAGSWGWGGRGGWGWGSGAIGGGWNDRYERQVYSERTGAFRR